MTYTQAKQTEQAQDWAIGIGSGKFQPKFKGQAIGIAHSTVDAARTFIISAIYYNSPEYKTWYQDQQNKLRRDFDIC